MFKNYFITALRNLKRHKGFSFINLSGLAIGMACSILFALFVIFELSFDTYHTKADRIYRVGTQFGLGVDNRGAFTAPPMAKALVNDFPEIENAARLSLWPRKYLVSYGEKKFLEEGIIFADNSIFDIFTFSHIAGNLKTALDEPFSIVITRDIAEKYFAEKNPIGESLGFAVWKKDFKITGVIENCPNNSHFKYRIIASMLSYQDDNSSWGSHNCFTYIALKKGCSASQLEAKFPAFVKRYWGVHHYKDTGQTYDEYIKSEKNYYGHFLEPLPDIHLNSNMIDPLSVRGNKIYIYIFSTIAVFILLIACINFMNLSTARFANRSREVGVRKVLGSGKKQLIFQFLGESVLLSFFALILAIMILNLVMPIFCHFTNRQLEFNLFSNVYILPVLVGYAILVGILAGSYPAFFLSSFPAIHTIKNSLNKKIKGFIPFRRVLVILQFSITIVILLGTFIIYQQLKFLQNSQLGFNKDQVLVVQRAYSLGKQRDAFKQELLKYPDILAVSNTETLPGRHFDPTSHKLEGRPLGEEYTLQTMYGDCDFAKLLDLEMVSGRYFSPGIPTDATSAVVINEAAVKKLGIKDPIGKRFVKEFGGAKKGEFVTIIGVVKDFHYFSLHHEILPMIIRPFSEENWRLTSIKIRAANIKETINLVRETWNKFTAGEPFEYSFLDADFNNLYINEQKTGQILGIFAFLAIFIACLGLFGMVSFSTEQRTKEIGIRKVLGASVSKIIFMLSKEVIILVLLAFALSAPLALYAMNKWLQDFAFRIEPNPLTFILMALITLLIALLTISFRTIKAACANPVDSIKHE
jgi:putative ABC transport system permease protein